MFATRSGFGKASGLIELDKVSHAYEENKAVYRWAGRLGCGCPRNLVCFRAVQELHYGAVKPFRRVEFCILSSIKHFHGGFFHRLSSLSSVAFESGPTLASFKIVSVNANPF
jgi:hypothetical protein